MTIVAVIDASLINVSALLSMDHLVSSCPMDVVESVVHRKLAVVVVVGAAAAATVSVVVVAA